MLHQQLSAGAPCLSSSREAARRPQVVGPNESPVERAVGEVVVIALYVESVGNPRKFARIARRVSASKPIIAIKAGRSPAGQRAGLSHTATAAASDVVVDALFTQAGVLRVDTMEQMLDAARVLCDQPLPRGNRVAVVGNSGGPGILTQGKAPTA